MFLKVKPPMPKTKFIGPVYLYNMLQDFRHLLIFDLRDSKSYQQIYIRDSFNVTEQATLQRIQQVIQLAQKKATQKQTKYTQLKRVRRYFFIGQKKLSEDDKLLQQVLSVLQKNSSPEDKIYSLDIDFAAFSTKYPFMCLTRQKNQQISKYRQQGLIQQADKLLLYPYSKFPSQIIADKLYLGNIYSSNSQKQLQDLKITSLVDFVHYNQNQKVPQFKSSDKYNYLHLPFNSEIAANIDFDVINEELDKMLARGKTLFYCKDGEVISPAFAIAYLMYKCKLDINMATLKVCQAISRVEICKWIYTQLLTYKPKK